jgi:hypothetical protein
MPVFEESQRSRIVRPVSRSSNTNKLNFNFLRQFWKLIPSVPVTFIQQIVIYLPYVVSFMVIVQIIASISLFNPTLYTNSSLELMPYGITEFWRQLYILNILFIVIFQITSLYGLFKRKSYAWWLLVIITGLMITNNILIINLFGVMFSVLWLILILQIQKEYS